MNAVFNNKVVKVLTVEHGAQVIDAWQRLGVDTNDLSGGCSEEGGRFYIYYGLIDGVFENYTIDDVTAANADIISLNDIKALLPQTEELSTVIMHTATSPIEYEYWHLTCNLRYNTATGVKVLEQMEQSSLGNQRWIPVLTVNEQTV
jgi:hypothetical protein